MRFSPRPRGPVTPGSIVSWVLISLEDLRQNGRPEYLVQIEALLASLGEPAAMSGTDLGAGADAWLPELIRMRYSTGEPMPDNAIAKATLEHELFRVESLHDVCHLIAFVEMCAAVPVSGRERTYRRCCRMINRRLAERGHPAPRPGYVFTCGRGCP